MATNYNITMRQFNGTDYDTLYPAANLSNSIGKIQASQVEGLSITPDMGDATGTLAVSHGGTGRTSLTSGYYLVGNGTGQVTLQSPSQLQSSLGLDQYAKIQTGSYTGTGTYGSSNPNSLTFDFQPKFFNVGTFTAKLTNSSYYRYSQVAGSLPDSTTDRLCVSIGDDNTSFGQTYFYPLTNGIKWAAEYQGNDWKQFNQSGLKYYYTAIGV